MADKVDFGPRIGCDPEVFVQDEAGTPVPICGLVGGTKENPIIVDKEIFSIWGRNNREKNSVGHYAIQEDNVMLEFNIPANQTSQGFTESIDKMLSYLPQYLAPSKLFLRLGNSYQSFASDVLSSNRQAMTIGCLPDFNAYAEEDLSISPEERFKRKPFGPEDMGNYRYCGGHIHVQYNKLNVPPHIFAQFMDVVACLPYLSWDKQRGRRLLYGQPGIYREKEYGIEYRTLSNFWLKPEFREKYHLLNMADNILWLARTANTAVGTLYSAYEKIRWDEVQTIIRNEDHKGAEVLLERISREARFPGG